MARAKVEAHIAEMLKEEAKQRGILVAELVAEITRELIKAHP